MLGVSKYIAASSLDAFAVLGFLGCWCFVYMRHHLYFSRFCREFFCFLQ